MGAPKTIHIFGVTGSIGRSTQDVILKHAERFDVHSVTAHSDVEGLAKAAIALNAKCAVIAQGKHLSTLQSLLAGHDIEALGGRAALIESARVPVDVVLAAIVGMAGLDVIWEAIGVSKAVALANKEPLVAAGDLVMARAAEYGCTILPVDSEHNAIFQVFDEGQRANIKRIILTASGGPFRGCGVDDLLNITPEQAVAHPNWSMGAKISVDSATMMNKALEVIEAYHLFDMDPAQIDVLVHPQSIVHSMVEYADGSVLAQMGASDMRTPISNVLAWPDRLETPGETLDLRKLSKLDFEEPDHEAFPFVRLAYECMEKGGSFCLAMNAANEIAVAAFLDKQIGFLDIMRCVETIVGSETKKELSSIAQVISYDEDVRARASAFVQKAASCAA